MKFKNKKDRHRPSISTASLPDIVFMLLFFFMVTTVIKTNNPPNITLPNVSTSEKIDKEESLNIVIREAYTNIFVVNGKSIKQEAIENYIGHMTSTLSLYDKSKIKVSLFVDKNVEMKPLYELKLILRKYELYNLNYMTLN